MAKRLNKPVWGYDEKRDVKKTFTELQWSLLSGDNNLKAGRWKRIDGPQETEPVKLKEKAPKVDATRGAIDLAKEKGIAIQSVEGTGDGGRIMKADVEEFLLDLGKDEEE